MDTYVTFIKRKQKKDGEIEIKRYAVKCGDDEKAREAAKKIYHLSGISHVRFNKCGSIKKGTKIIAFDADYEKAVKGGKAVPVERKIY